MRLLEIQLHVPMVLEPLGQLTPSQFVPSAQFATSQTETLVPIGIALLNSTLSLILFTQDGIITTTCRTITTITRITTIIITGIIITTGITTTELTV